MDWLKAFLAGHQGAVFGLILVVIGLIAMGLGVPHAVWVMGVGLFIAAFNF